MKTFGGLALVLAPALAGGASASHLTGLPLGSFRTSITDQDLEDARAYSYMDQNHGTFTPTIEGDGKFRVDQKAPNYLEASMHPWRKVA
jgi:hypothetical protein